MSPTIFSRILAALIFSAVVVALPAIAAPAPAKKGSRELSAELNERGAKAYAAEDFVAAEDNFRRAIEADAGNLAAVANLTGTYLINKKSDAALSLVQSYIARVPQDAELNLRLGDVHFSRKELIPAAAAYEKAYQLNPQIKGLPAKLASVYVLNNRIADAETMLLKAVEQDPKNPAMLSSLAGIYLERGKPAESIAVVKRALQIKATPGLYVTMGDAYERLGDERSALISYRRARDMGGTRPELDQKISELESKIS